jgi:hypothetical protein
LTATQYPLRIELRWSNPTEVWHVGTLIMASIGNEAGWDALTPTNGTVIGTLEYTGTNFSLDPSSTPYIDINPGVVYYFKVFTFNSTVEAFKTYSSGVKVSSSPLPNPVGATAPSSPDPVSIDGLLNGYITVNRPLFKFALADSDGDQLKYWIQVDRSRSFNSPSIFFKSTTLLTQPVTGEYTVGQTGGEYLSPLTGGAGMVLADGTYYWRVRAEDTTSVLSGWHTESSAFIVDTTVPGKVVNLSGTPGVGQVNFSWINPADADFDGVRIMRGVSTFPATSTDGISVYDTRGLNGGVASSTSHTSLNEGTYYYTVFAYDRAGNFSTGETTAVLLEVSPPIVSGKTPTAESYITNVKPTILANYADSSGVNVGSVVLKLDNTAVTPEVKTASSVSYQVSNALSEGTHTVALTVADISGNTTVETWSFMVDLSPPKVAAFKINDVRIFSQDIITAAPKIEVNLTDNGKLKSAVLYVDGQAKSFAPTSPQTNTSWIMTYDYKAQAEPALSLGSGHTISIEAFDLAGNVTREAVTNLEVRGGVVEVIGTPLNYPNPFRPARSESTNISYTITVDAEIHIYMYNVAGEMVWRSTYTEGTVGGRAGYNEVSWNGITDFGEVAGNGIYFYRIVSNNRAIGKGKLTVLD